MTAVTAATIIIPIVSAAGERHTSADTLDTQPGAADQGLAAAPPADLVDYDGVSDVLEPRQWGVGSVAVDSDFSTMPEGGEFGCSPEQVTWLEERGTRDVFPEALVSDADILLTGSMYNDATTGGSLSVRNVRVEGAYQDQQPPRIQFWCQRGGEGAEVVPVWLGATLGDPSPATYIDPPSNWSWGDSSPDLVGQPLNLNLAPGEYADLYLFLQSPQPERDFVGRVIADVVVGDETHQTLLREGYLQTAPAQVKGLVILQAMGNRLFCLPDDSLRSDVESASLWEGNLPTQYECTREELMAKIAELTP